MRVIDQRRAGDLLADGLAFVIEDRDRELVHPFRMLLQERTQAGFCRILRVVLGEDVAAFYVEDLQVICFRLLRVYVRSCLMDDVRAAGQEFRISPHGVVASPEGFGDMEATSFLESNFRHPHR